jgi:serine protease Do
MDEKDRHIVTFGEDETKPNESNGFTVENNFTYSTDIPKQEEPKANEVVGDTFVMRPSEPEAEEVKVDPIEEVKSEPREVYTARRMAPTGPAHVRPTPQKEKKYVTRGALIACMIVTMLISALLGALFAGAFSGGSSSNERQSRNDSELSELNLSEATGSKLTVKEIVDKNADAVVEIVVEGTTQGMWGQMQLTQGAGSGVIVKENGYIATNYHVVQGANKVQVTLHNGDVYNAKIIDMDDSNDIAVIKIDAKGLTTATIGDSSKVEVGDLAVAIGNPLGQLGGTATSGIISALDRTLTIEGTTLTLLQTDAAINGGNSGGGLFNGSGELIGIVESKAEAVGVEGLAFAIPINTVSGIINDMIENGASSHNASSETPAVGVVISEVSEQNAQYYGLDSAGVYIAQVTGNNALKAGFKEQDRIVSIDGQEISTSREFISIVRKHKIGDTVTIVVSREGQEIEIKTELEALQATSN